MEVAGPAVAVGHGEGQGGGPRKPRRGRDYEPVSDHRHVDTGHALGAQEERVAVGVADRGSQDVARGRDPGDTGADRRAAPLHGPVVGGRGLVEDGVARRLVEAPVGSQSSLVPGQARGQVRANLGFRPGAAPEPDLIQRAAERRIGGIDFVGPAEINAGRHHGRVDQAEHCCVRRPQAAVGRMDVERFDPRVAIQHQRDVIPLVGRDDPVGGGHIVSGCPAREPRGGIDLAAAINPQRVGAHRVRRSLVEDGHPVETGREIHRAVRIPVDLDPGLECCGVSEGERGVVRHRHEIVPIQRQRRRPAVERREIVDDRRVGIGFHAEGEGGGGRGAGRPLRHRQRLGVVAERVPPQVHHAQARFHHEVLAGHGINRDDADRVEHHRAVAVGGVGDPDAEPAGCGGEDPEALPRPAAKCRAGGRQRLVDEHDAERRDGGAIKNRVRHVAGPAIGGRPRHQEPV